MEAIADRPDSLGLSDMVIFEVGCRKDRAVITNSIKDSRPARRSVARPGPRPCRANPAKLAPAA